MRPTILQRLRTLASDHEGSLALLGATLPIGCAKSGPVDPVRGSDTTPPVTAAQEAGTDALSELFQDGSPEDVAAKLEAMVDANAEASAAEAAAPRTVPPRRPPKSDPNSMRPVYKGVSF